MMYEKYFANGFVVAVLLIAIAIAIESIALGALGILILFAPHKN